MVPLSFAQARLWFLNKIERNASYHVPLLLRLRGAVDVEALRAALRDVLDRHEPLRTVFPETGGVPEQRVLDDIAFDVPLADCGADGLDAQVRAFAAPPFDLAAELPVRATLFRTGPAEHALLVVMHHIASDGWSTGVLVREFSQLYESYSQGQASALAELA
ncbi:MAG TPA: condensation domain-containing protein, partial [Amycolatopsis sp.]|nr:condensation domain-containing protein [Amycolatopsis sp.]